MSRIENNGRPETFRGMLDRMSQKENIDVKLILTDGTERFINYAGYLLHSDKFMIFLGDMEKKVYPKIIASIEVDGEKIISF